MPANNSRTGLDLRNSSQHERGEAVHTKLGSQLGTLERGILQAVGYADVFNFPLTATEIWRNLVKIEISEKQVIDTLRGSKSLAGQLHHEEELYMLSGRQKLVKIRRRRAAASAILWERARYYGAVINQLPFVRMVAVTGALAVNNSEASDDIDFLVVTEPGRLWLARAFTILVVKMAARRGDLICPNYFLSDQALALPERDIFTAHELAQMVPLSGFDVYRQMIAQNRWAQRLMPNMDTSEPQKQAAAGRLMPTWSSRFVERLLRTPPGGWLEGWEMARKQARFNRQPVADEGPGDPLGTPSPLIEVAFDAHRCKGHFSRHGQRTLQRFTSHLERLSPAETGD
jgi:hypothetical protein